jgi:putative phage-type endonuclease
MNQVIAQPQRALRLASTKGMSRDEWLIMRKQGIGSSDAAAAIGLNPYQSPLELWMIKTGREENLPKIDPNDESHPTYWGNILEPIVAAHYTKHTGLKVRKTNAILQHPDADKAWMLANIDYSIVGSKDVQILECKTAGEFGSRLWREGPPEYVQVQVQHQLAVTGRQVVDVCVLLHGQKIEIHRVERDDEVIARLIELERRFWEYVITETPPPADGSESAGKALQALYPFDRGQTLDLTDEGDFTAAFTDLISVRTEIKSAEERESQLKQRIQERMGEASYARFSTGSVSWKRNKAGSRRFVINA